MVCDFDPELRRVQGTFTTCSSWLLGVAMNPTWFMAGSTGFEPAIFSVTGRRDNRYTTTPRSDRKTYKLYQ